MTSAIDFFAAKLAFETDVADVAAALAGGDPGFLLVDSRSEAAWRRGRLPGARHLPTATLAGRLTELDPRVPIVTYCWGPGCNGATRSALALARLGFQVRELVGGFEYWVREGGVVVTDEGSRAQPMDPLTTAAAIDCGC
jgi:rhodanese-related sulfurtransferase